MRVFPKSTFLALLLIAIIVSPATAKLEVEPGADAWCGTDDRLLERTFEKHLYHQRQDRRAARNKSTARSGLKTEVRKNGNVAVAIDNDGRMIRERNVVDLEDGFAMQFKFKKKQGGYQIKRAGSFSDQIGPQLQLTDDDAVRIDLPFKVKVFGKRYDQLYVNSDGNLTFEAPDAFSTARDIGRFLEGPPRLAPFFGDLNPETAPAGGGVFAQVGAKSVRVTWIEVPKFSDEGFSNQRNTFQITLAKNGKVTFSYGEMGSNEGIVGVAPGGGSNLNLLDYSAELPAPVNPGAIAESFSTQRSVDETVIARVFLENFSDRYKSLVVFTDFPLRLLGNIGTIAYEQTVKNDIRGIGEPQYDFTNFYGSGGALESFVMMGEVAKYGNDIDNVNQLGGKYSPLEILMHELGHRWGVKTLFDDNGQTSEALLGRGMAHWSYCFNSKNSYLEGNSWADGDNDGIFTAVVGPASFNDFDLYSMGLLDPQSVESSFVVATSCNGDRAPSFQAATSGTVKNVTIDDVIRALGNRQPAFPAAPQEFEVAFLLLVLPGEEPNPGSVALVDAYRQGIEQRLRAQGGTFVTRLRTKN